MERAEGSTYEARDGLLMVNLLNSSARVFVDIFVMAITIIYGPMPASGQCFRNTGCRTVQVKSLPS